VSFDSFHELQNVLVTTDFSETFFGSSERTAELPPWLGRLLRPGSAHTHARRVCSDASVVVRILFSARIVQRKQPSVAPLKLFDKLDQWIRRRLRMCYWKRWRYPRTRSRELMRSDVSRRQAIRHGKSRKVYWHVAKTIASGVGMTNKWLQEQGLVSLKNLWASLAHPLINTTRVEPHGADPHTR
jgi:hypothetical protein